MKLGFDGYSAIVNKMMGNAHYLAESIVKSGSFELLNGARHIPVVTFKQKEKKKFTLFDLSYKLRERGWIVPAYSLPPEANDTTIMRVVVRENFTSDMVDIFVQDLMNAEKTLENGNQSQTKAYSRNAHSVS